MTDFWKDYCSNLQNGERPDLNSKEENVRLILMINYAIRNRFLHEALLQLAERGPLFDGDVISKNFRDQLLDCGACSKVLVNGEDGFNACTYLGRNLLKVYNWLFGHLGQPQ